MNILSLSLVLGSALASLAPSSAYVQAPVTDDMRSAAVKVLSALLPTGTTPGAVTSANSVAWQRLAYITDTFGPRFSGSDSLEEVLSWVALTASSIDGLNVSEQPTMIPKWVRGAESATLLTPRVKKLHMVGLGESSPGNVTAPIFVVGSNEELLANCSKAAGTIVLFDVIFTTYDNTVPTRANAGLWAVACGGVGALIRSVGPYSLQNPHTGHTMAAGIPTAAVSLEDAAQLRRMFERGQTPTVNLCMESQTFPFSPSRNLLIDLTGTDLPEEIVLLSGHGDSWDISEGAMDDGGGFVTAWEALRVLHALGLRARRTIRAVVWVNEENGAAGGKTYANLVNLTAHSWMSECDGGAFQPYGIGVSCAAGADCSAAVTQLTTLGAELLAPIGSGNVSVGGEGTDIAPSCSQGVVCSGFNVLDPRITPDTNNPCMSDSKDAWTLPTFNAANLPYDSQYFWVHHSSADTIERMDPRQLNHVAAASAVWAYSIALLPALLPRDAPAPSPTPSPSTLPARTPAAGVIVGSALASTALAGAAIFFYFKVRYAAERVTSNTVYNPLVAQVASDPVFAGGAAA